MQIIKIYILAIFLMLFYCGINFSNLKILMLNFLKNHFFLKIFIIYLLNFLKIYYIYLEFLIDMLLFFVNHLKMKLLNFLLNQIDIYLLFLMKYYLFDLNNFLLF